MLQICNESKEIKYYLKLSSIEFLINKDLDIAEKNYLECLRVANITNDYSKTNVLVMLSEIYCFKNDLKKAIEYTRQALELKPYDRQILLHLAGYYAMDKQFSQARPIFESLLSCEPKNEYYQYLIKTLDEDEKNYKQTESD